MKALKGTIVFGYCHEFVTDYELGKKDPEYL